MSRPKANVSPIARASAAVDNDTVYVCENLSILLHRRSNNIRVTTQIWNSLDGYLELHLLGERNMFFIKYSWIISW
jgi:hypothetical protein